MTEDWDGESYCTADRCRRPAAHRQLSGMVDDIPVYDLVCCRHARSTGTVRLMVFLLWLLAVILVIAGIVEIARGALVVGIVLIVVGLLVGPGGVSIFT